MVVDDTTNLLSICEGIYKVFTGNCCRNGGNQLFIVCLYQIRNAQSCYCRRNSDFRSNSTNQRTSSGSNSTNLNWTSKSTE